MSSWIRTYKLIKSPLHLMVSKVKGKFWVVRLEFHIHLLLENEERSWPDFHSREWKASFHLLFRRDCLLHLYSVWFHQFVEIQKLCFRGQSLNLKKKDCWERLWVFHQWRLVLLLMFLHIRTSYKNSLCSFSSWL